jgi:hypothetical protein
MALIVRDLELEPDIADGFRIETSEELHALLARLRKRSPSGCEFEFEDHFRLKIGFCSSGAFAEHMSIGSLPPYLVAVAPTPRPAADEKTVFMIGGSWTEIPTRYVIDPDCLANICLKFLATGDRWSGVAWEEI